MGTEEVTQFLTFLANQLHGRNRFIIELLYGSGLRVSQCLRLRVQDIDIERDSLTVRGGDGDGKGRSLGEEFVS
ncbi:tyrosine-type recombinase/integrase [Vibrio sp. 1636]|nr:MULTISPECIES: tyrosine-type recombinase/integrase [Vibrio]MDW2200646.1 tyrosine-type recombinase/integrase [Vibrio sp. 1636]